MSDTTRTATASDAYPSLRRHLFTYASPIVVVLSLAYPALSSDDGPLLLVFRVATIALIGLVVPTGIYMWCWLRKLDTALNDSDQAIDHLRTTLDTHLIMEEIRSWPESRGGLD